MITSRNVDIGSLVSPGVNEVAASTTTTPTVGLFGIARTDVLRVQVDLPQTYYQSATTGAEAKCRFASFPIGPLREDLSKCGGFGYFQPHVVDRDSYSNSDNVLLPGMYAQVRITPSKSQATLRIPANTLLFDSKGTRVAIVNAQNVVHLRPIREGRDFGTELEILSGVKLGDRLVTTPPTNCKMEPLSRLEASRLCWPLLFLWFSFLPLARQLQIQVRPQDPKRLPLA